MQNQLDGTVKDSSNVRWRQDTLQSSWKRQGANLASAFSKTLAEDEDAILVQVMEASLREYEATKTRQETSTSTTPIIDSFSLVRSNEKNTAPPQTRAPSAEPLPYTATFNDSAHLDGFDVEAGASWLYPINYPLRDYQYKIVETSLFKNTLVCLPTGLGKTFIAAVVMANFYRWYPTGKIVFLAPTRPLVAQQIQACYSIMGIPEEDTVEMTGAMKPSLRKAHWEKRRIFFLTPQTIQNDLLSELCPADAIRLLVVDEAHKASGQHAYCVTTRRLFRATRQFRVLALTATPGGDIQAVQEVINNLLVAHIELRTDECEDIRRYSFERLVETIVVPPDEEVSKASELLMNICEPLVAQLKQAGAVWPRLTAQSLSMFQLVQQKEEWQRKSADSHRADQGIVLRNFGITIALYHAFDLLQRHGLRPLFSYMQGIVNGEKSSPAVCAELGRMPQFHALWDLLEVRYGAGSQAPFVGGHPKLVKLRDIVVGHFESFESRKRNCENSNQNETRVIVFSQYRESVAEIVTMLQMHAPLVRPVAFVGQAGSGTSASNGSRGSIGLCQRDQLRVMTQFRDGTFNTLIATCVGEEGLDIGEVDLIVCFDSASSPIRLIQRVGRTGRKRAGRIVMLLSKGKEEANYSASLNKKRLVNRAILDGYRQLTFYPGNPRMVPLGTEPSVEMHRVETLPLRRKIEGQVRSKKTNDSGKMGIFTEADHEKWRNNLQLSVEASARIFCQIAAPQMLSLSREENDGLPCLSEVMHCNDHRERFERLEKGHLVHASSLSHHFVGLAQLCRQHRRGHTNLLYHALGLRQLDISTAHQDEQTDSQCSGFDVNREVAAAAGIGDGSVSLRQATQMQEFNDDEDDDFDECMETSIEINLARVLPCASSPVFSASLNRAAQQLTRFKEDPFHIHDNDDESDESYCESDMVIPEAPSETDTQFLLDRLSVISPSDMAQKLSTWDAYQAVVERRKILSKFNPVLSSSFIEDGSPPREALVEQTDSSFKKFRLHNESKENIKDEIPTREPLVEQTDFHLQDSSFEKFVKFVIRDEPESNIENRSPVREPLVEMTSYFSQEKWDENVIQMCKTKVFELDLDQHASILSASEPLLLKEESENFVDFKISPIFIRSAICSSQESLTRDSKGVLKNNVSLCRPSSTNNGIACVANFSMKENLLNNFSTQKYVNKFGLQSQSSKMVSLDEKKGSSVAKLKLLNSFYVPNVDKSNTQSCQVTFSHALDLLDCTSSDTHNYSLPHHRYDLSNDNFHLLCDLLPALTDSHSPLKDESMSVIHETAVNTSSFTEDMMFDSEVLEAASLNGETLDKVSTLEETQSPFLLAKQKNKRRISDCSIDSVRTPSQPKSKRRRQGRKCDFLLTQASQDTTDASSSTDNDVEYELNSNEDHYEQSFVDDSEGGISMNRSAMRAIYMQSIRSPLPVPGAFKIPARFESVATPDHIFSQLPDQDSDYQADSFCVHENDLSTLRREERERRQRRCDRGRPKDKKKRIRKAAFADSDSDFT